MNTVTETYNHFHYAAAVLATYDPATLRPVGPSPDDPADAESEREDLLIDSSPTPSAGAGRWRLDPDVRRAVLRAMGSRAAMQVALAANPDGAEGAIQQMLTAVIRDQLPALETLTVEQLSSLIQVTEWLDGILAGLPTLPDLHSRFEQVMLLEPFRRLGGEHFRGRRKQLASLRAFVGVLDPHTAQPDDRDRRSGAGDQAASKPPRLIYAPGGQGKSALVARFIYEHATLPQAERFPWVYLDFDRPMLRPQSPYSLLSEGTLQLGLQYPVARDAVERIRAGWRERVDRYAAQGMLEQDGWETLLTDFQNLLAQLRVEGDPLLFVLDTFEQVQARPDEVVRDLMRFLHRLQETTPQVRLLISGRGSLRQNPPLLQFPDWKFEEELLGPFEREEAQGYLEGRKLPPAEAVSVAAQVTVRTPLALVLAADLWHKRTAAGESGPLLGDSAEAAAAAELFGYTLRQNEIEGILFGRILLRVDDPDVRKLAYPGLVLRRITPDLIRDVLARHCGVDLPNPSRAAEIYEAMRREVQLVTEHSTASGPLLRHRPELRSMMLRLMQEAGGEKRARMDAIEEAAIAWYGERTDAESRGELVYHLLRRRRPPMELDAIWDAGPVELTWPDDVLEELPLAERGWLRTRLGHTLSAEERAAADLDGWERDTGRQGRELLAARPEAVLQLLAERRNESGSRYTGASPLYALEAAAYEKLGNWAAALEAITAGLEAAAAANSQELALALHTLRMRVASHIADRAALRQSADRARVLARRMRDQGDPAMIEVEATHADSLRRLDDDNLPDALEILRRLLAAAGPPDAAMKTLPPELASLCGYLLAEVDPTVTWAAVVAAGLPADTAGLRRLALTLAGWDREVSKARHQPFGTLARRLELPLSGRLEESWTTAVLERGSADVQALLQALLAEFEKAPLPVMKAVADLLARRAVALGQEVASLRSTESTENVGDRIPLTDVRGSDESASDRPSIQPPTHLTGTQAGELGTALLESFTLDEFEGLLAASLDARIEAITMNPSFSLIVYDVIAYFNKRGQIIQLVTAALDARPNSPSLRAFAAPLGLTVETDEDQLTGFIAAASFLNLDSFRARLGQMEGRICRIEIAGRFGGLGFLVGPNLVLTPGAAISTLVAGEQKPEAVQLRFGVRSELGGRLSRGVAYILAADWLVGQRSAARILDYMLVRTAGTPGYDALAGQDAQSSAAQRGWFPLPANPPVLTAGAGLAILDCSDDGPLHLYLGADAFAGFDEGGASLRYNLPEAPGSPGALVCTADLEPVGMHVERSSEDISYAAVLAAVAAEMLAHGLGDLLQGPDSPAAAGGQIKGIVQAGARPPGQQPTDSRVSALLARARQVLESSGSEAAMTLYTQAVVQAAEDASRTGDVTVEAGARLELAHVYFQIGELAPALDMAQNALALYRSGGDRTREADALNLLGSIYAATGENRRAVDLYEQYLALARELGDRRAEGNALGNLGAVYTVLDETQLVIEVYEQQLVIMREIGDRSGEGYALGRLSNAYADLGKTDHAAELFDQQLAIMREIGDRRGESAALGRRGRVYAALGDTGRAVELYEQWLRIARETGDRVEEGIALSQLGAAYTTLGETACALESFARTIEIAHEIKDRGLEAEASWELGLLYEQAGEVAAAGELFQSAVAYERQIGHPSAAAHAEYLADAGRLGRNFYTARQVVNLAQHRLWTAAGEQRSTACDQLLAAQARMLAAAQQWAAGSGVSARSDQSMASSAALSTRSLASTGLRIDVQLLMPSVPAAIYSLLNEDDFPLLRCTITTTASFKRVRITSFIEGYSAIAAATIELKRGQVSGIVVFQQPLLLAETVRSLPLATPATLNILAKDLDTEKIELHQTLPIWLLPPNAAAVAFVDSGGAWIDLSRFLGAFVTPNDPALLQFLRRTAAEQPLLRLDSWSANRAGDLETADVSVHVQALCGAIRQVGGIEYTPADLDFHAGAGVLSYPLRPPAQCLSERRASAVDLAVLIASLLEAMSINAALVALPAQVLVAWELSPQSNQWQHLDTSLLYAGGFVQAAEVGNQLATAAQKQLAASGISQWYRRWPLRELRGVHRIYPVAI